jgi:hypothetical protein
VEPPWDDDSAADLATHIGWEIYSCAWAARQSAAPTFHVDLASEDDQDCARDAYRDLVLVHARVVQEFFVKPHGTGKQHKDDIRVSDFDSRDGPAWPGVKPSRAREAEGVLTKMVDDDHVNKYVLHPTWTRATGRQVFDLVAIAAAATDLGCCWLDHLRSTRPGAATKLPWTVDRAVRLLEPLEYRKP